MSKENRALIVIALILTLWLSMISIKLTLFIVIVSFIMAIFRTYRWCERYVAAKRRRRRRSKLKRRAATTNTTATAVVTENKEVSIQNPLPKEDKQAVGKEQPTTKKKSAKVDKMKLANLFERAATMQPVSLEELQGVSGEVFEKVICCRFVALGFEVCLTPTSGDFGADLLVTLQDGSVTAIQIKRYSGAVGVQAVYEVLGAKVYYQTDAAAVLTNAEFTKNAQILAQDAKVTLFDREDLKKYFKFV